jgi:hypothetical protein
MVTFALDKGLLLTQVCSDFLSHYVADNEHFLSQIITGDERWIHHFELQTKKSQQNGTTQLLLRTSLELPHQQIKSWPLFFGMLKG